jgi:hypothetical protein
MELFLLRNTGDVIMAIFGIGAFYDEDVSQDFIRANLIGVGWGENDAPELHKFVRTLKVGDIVYIKAYPPGGSDIIVKGIGIIIDDTVRTEEDSDGLISCGRNVRWVNENVFRIPRPRERNNVRSNTMYEEFHPEVQRIILENIIATV